VGLLVTIVSLNGCDSPTTVVTPLLQTDAASYTLVRSADAYETRIRYVFTNRTGGPVYLANCQGSIGLLLERYEGGEWKTAWSPLFLACVSPPIVIGRGDTFMSSIHVWAAKPDPWFDLANPKGTYRIVWTAARSSFQDDLGFGPRIPMEFRVSNSFEFVLP